MYHPHYFYFLFLCVIWLLPLSLHAQNQTGTDTLRTSPVLPDTVQTQLPDTLQPAARDTLPPPADTETYRQQPRPDFVTGGVGQRPDSRSSQRQAADGAVNFQARDSLIFNFRGQRKGELFGSANVTHQSGSLDAGKIDLDLEKNLVEARALQPQDTLSYPILRRENDDLRSTRILFNYETEKGKFEVAEIQVDDGYLIGTKVKNVSQTEVFIEDGIYSTCPPDHMYYYIRAERMKVVDEEEIFFTNARLYILDIPYPLVFPFGYVPGGIDSRQSGLLEPTYITQNTSSRGLGVQRLGWFQYFNDFLVGQTSFDLFTSGTFFNETRFQYNRTDRYRGSVTLGYSRERGLESTDLGFGVTTSRRVSINHSQELSPFANISADINLNTSNFFRRNSFDLDERAQTSSTSRVAYRFNHPEGIYNFSATTNLNQQFDTNVARLTGPETNFSLRQFQPFERSRPGTTEQQWYERISVNYRNRFRSNFNFVPIDRDSAEVNFLEALFNPSRFREATGDDRHVQYGMLHTAGVTAAQLLPSQFLNVSASINYNEYWYPTSTRREFVPEENRAVPRLERGIATARDFNTSLNFTTTFYGISQMKLGSFEGLRHTLRPNVSFNYRPDFSDDFWGFFETVQVDTLGNTQRFSRFDREVFGGPPAGEQQTMAFGISNILETKRVRRDSTGEIQSTNVRLIDNLAVNSSYNFAADSLNLGNINMTLTSRVLDGIRIQANAAFTAYERDQQGRFINTFLWNSGGKILQPLNYRVSASTNFSGGGRGVRIQTPAYRPYNPLNQMFFSPIDEAFNERPVQPIRSPWSFGLDFSYSWTLRTGQPARETAVLNANNIRFQLTPKWSFSTRIGYDFIEGELTPSQFNLSRDLVCWSMSFQFNPIGDFQYYAFRLSLNHGQIQSLFQKLPGLNNLERSSAPTGRPPRF